MLGKEHKAVPVVKSSGIFKENLILLEYKMLKEKQGKGGESGRERREGEREKTPKSQTDRDREEYKKVRGIEK